MTPVVFDLLLEGDLDSEGLTVGPDHLLAVCPLHSGALLPGVNIAQRPTHGLTLLPVAGHRLLHNLRDQVGLLAVSAGVDRDLSLIHHLVHQLALLPGVVPAVLVPVKHLLAMLIDDPLGVAVDLGHIPTLWSLLDLHQ